MLILFQCSLSNDFKCITHHEIFLSWCLKEWHLVVLFCPSFSFRLANLHTDICSFIHSFIYSIIKSITFLSSDLSTLLANKTNGKFSGSFGDELFKNYYLHIDKLSKDLRSVISVTRTQQSAPLKNETERPMCLSCPAVSHIFLNLNCE